MSLRTVALGLGLGLALPACSVGLSSADAAGVTMNECSTASDCGGGTCWSGTCVAHDGVVATALLEITPPQTAPGVGGARILQLASGLERSGVDYQLDLPRVSTLHGFVRSDASAQRAACGGELTVPAEVTLTPREHAFGLPTPSYVARTKQVPVSPSCRDQLPVGASNVLYEFSVEVPAGSYDVYVRPEADVASAGAGAADGGAPADCVLVPQLFRGGNGITVGPGENCFPISSTAPTELSLELLWPETAPSLTGWTVDVVHPVTGQLLSSRVKLSGASAPLASGASGYSVAIRYSPTLGDASAPSGKELVRLQPPEGVVAPTVHMELAALQATGKVAVVPALGPFPPVVPFVSTMVSEQGVSEPVPGVVTLTSTKLDGIPSGIFATYSTTMVVGADGSVEARVPPGEYRVRAVPQAGLDLAAREQGLSLACLRDAVDVSRCSAQAEERPRTVPAIQVSRSATIRGVALSPLGQGGVDGASVQAIPAAAGARRCDPGEAAASCFGEPAGILDQSLGDEAFVPRPVGGATDARGAFELREVDCGGCTADTGALFDLSVVPPEGSRLPWLVRAGLDVGGDLDLGRLPVPLPVARRGVVQVPVPGTEPVPVPGALIRAYLLRDAAGDPIKDPTGLSGCSQGQTTRCIRSVLQLAETRASVDGTFELLLPSAIQ